MVEGDVEVAVVAVEDVEEVETKSNESFRRR